MTNTIRLRPDTTPAASRVPAWFWVFLLAAMLVAPWLGAVHSVIHAKAPAVSAVSDASPAIGLRSLFGEHSHDGDCRIYDQLSHADGVKNTFVLPPAILPPVAVLAWHAGECLRRWATLFDARGPPLLA